MYKIHPNLSILDFDLAKTQDFYPTKSVTSNSDWNISSWLWYTCGAVLTIALLYFVYSMFTSNEFIDSIAPNQNKIDKGKASIYPSDISQPGTPNITIFDESSNNPQPSIINKISSYLNPFNYFTTQDQVDSKFKDFLDYQLKPAQANFKLYPYTVENPFDSWFKKLNISIFGESSNDAIERIRLKRLAFADLDHLRVRVDTPSIASVGLGTYSPFPSNVVWDQIQATNLENRLRNLPTTPQLSPRFTPIELPDVNVWQNQTVEPENIASSTRITTEQ